MQDRPNALYSRRVKQLVDERRLLVKNTHTDARRERERRTDRRTDERTAAKEEEKEERRGCNIDESGGRRQKAKQSISSQSVSRCNRPTARPS